MVPETGSHRLALDSMVPTDLLPPTCSFRLAADSTVPETAEPKKVPVQEDDDDDGPPPQTFDAWESGVGSFAGSAPPQLSCDWVEDWQKRMVEDDPYVNAAFWTSLAQHQQYMTMLMMGGMMYPPMGYPMPDSSYHLDLHAEWQEMSGADADAASAGGKGAGKNKSKGKSKDVPAKQPKSREKTKDKDHLKTTVMVKNIPDAYDRDRLVEMLNTVFDGKFKTKFDFAYLPFDFKTSKRLGYAFVNFFDHGTAEAFMQAFDGFTGEGFAEEDSRKIKNTCKGEVAWCHTHGKADHIQKYQNSPLMHHDVDPMHKPMIFDHLGNMEKWEPPKKGVNAPRQVQRAQRQHK